MTWNAPVQATTNQVVTSAFWNAQIYDNFRETAPFKATAGGSRIFVSTSANQIAERVIVSDFNQDDGASQGTTFGDLSGSTGPNSPQVTVTTGTTVLVALRAEIVSGSGSAHGFMSYEVSGATSLGAADNKSISFEQTASTNSQSAGFGGLFYQSGLTAGSNTFTAKYRHAGSSALFSHRGIIVIPIA